MNRGWGARSTSHPSQRGKYPKSLRLDTLNDPQKPRKRRTKRLSSEDRDDSEVRALPVLTEAERLKRINSASDAVLRPGHVSPGPEASYAPRPTTPVVCGRTGSPLPPNQGVSSPSARNTPTPTRQGYTASPPISRHGRVSPNGNSPLQARDKRVSSAEGSPTILPTGSRQMPEAVIGCAGSSIVVEQTMTIATDVDLDTNGDGVRRTVSCNESDRALPLTPMSDSSAVSERHTDIDNETDRQGRRRRRKVKVDLGSRERVAPSPRSARRRKALPESPPSSDDEAVPSSQTVGTATVVEEREMNSHTVTTVTSTSTTRTEEQVTTVATESQISYLHIHPQDPGIPAQPIPEAKPDVEGGEGVDTTAVSSAPVSKPPRPTNSRPFAEAEDTTTTTTQSQGKTLTGSYASNRSTSSNTPSKNRTRNGTGVVRDVRELGRRSQPPSSTGNNHSTHTNTSTTSRSRHQRQIDMSSSSPPETAESSRDHSDDSSDEAPIQPPSFLRSILASRQSAYAIDAYTIPATPARGSGAAGKVGRASTGSLARRSRSGQSLPPATSDSGNGGGDRSGNGGHSRNGSASSNTSVPPPRAFAMTDSDSGMEDREGYRGDDKGHAEERVEGTAEEQDAVTPVVAVLLSKMCNIVSYARAAELNSDLVEKFESYQLESWNQEARHQQRRIDRVARRLEEQARMEALAKQRQAERVKEREQARRRAIAIQAGRRKEAKSRQEAMNSRFIRRTRSQDTLPSNQQSSTAPSGSSNTSTPRTSASSSRAGIPPKAVSSTATPRSGALPNTGTPRRTASSARPKSASTRAMTGVVGTGGVSDPGSSGSGSARYNFPPPMTLAAQDPDLAKRLTDLAFQQQQTVKNERSKKLGSKEPARIFRM